MESMTAKIMQCFGGKCMAIWQKKRNKTKKILPAVSKSKEFSLLVYEFANS